MLTKEDFDSLPEKAQAGFALDEQSGEYVPVKDAKLKQTLDDLDGKFKALEQENRKQGETLAEFEQRQQEKLDEAREKALAEAESKSDVKQIKAYYAEREEDIRKQEREKARTEVRQEFLTEQATQKASSIADAVGLTIGVDPESAEALGDLVRNRVKVDPDTQQEQFFDKKGSALSVDRKGFEEMVTKEYPRLCKSNIATNGGGNANGSNGSGAPRKPLKDMTDAERLEFKQRDPVGFQNAIRGR